MSARAARQSIGTAASAAWVGVEQLTAATSSISVRSVWWPTEEMTGTRKQGDRAAQRLIAEREQVGERAAAARDDHHLHLLDRGQLAQRGRDRGRGVAVLDGRERPHQAARPAAPAQAREHVVAGLAALAGDDTDRARERGPGQALLGLEQPVRVQAPAQPLELEQEVALAGDPQLGDREA